MKLLFGVVALIALLAIWFVRGILRMRARATPIHKDDPWLHQAMSRARDSFESMKQLAAEGQQVAIKFPLKNSDGDIEHVWGGVQSVSDEGVQVAVLTPLFVGPTPEGMVSVPLAELEDWQAFLPDGGIRGGFTTQAQIAVCHREGFHIPRALLQQEPHFIDRLEFQPSTTTP